MQFFEAFFTYNFKIVWYLIDGDNNKFLMKFFKVLFNIWVTFNSTGFTILDLIFSLSSVAFSFTLVNTLSFMVWVWVIKVLALSFKFRSLYKSIYSIRYLLVLKYSYITCNYVLMTRITEGRISTVTLISTETER